MLTYTGINQNMYCVKNTPPPLLKHQTIGQPLNLGAYPLTKGSRKYIRPVFNHKTYVLIWTASLKKTNLSLLAIDN